MGKCGHLDPVSACQCIREQIGNNNERKFMVATQDMELARGLRGIPGVPILRLNGPVPFLEEPSNVTRKLADTCETKKLVPSAWEQEKLPALHERVLKSVESAQKPQKKRKSKGVNPLSCLKPKK